MAMTLDMIIYMSMYFYIGARALAGHFVAKALGIVLCVRLSALSCYNIQYYQAAFRAHFYFQNFYDGDGGSERMAKALWRPSSK